MQANTIRVLLADDSSIVRHVLTEALGFDAEIEIVGAARHGGEVLHILGRTQPDLVLLDVEMPVMDGVQTVLEIRKRNLQVPIIMFSAITTRGGEATLDALKSGANDYVTKPTALGHVDEAIKFINIELVPKIKVLGRRYRCQVNSLSKSGFGAVAAAQRPSQLPPVNRADHPAHPVNSGRPVEIVAIGTSTGGPTALRDVLRHLPGEFPAPIVVVQHMPAVFTKLLAMQLDEVCPLNVREGVEGAVLQPGQVWIAPGNFHLSVQNRGVDRVLHLEQSPHENSCRPAVDPLFRSVATVYGSRCLGVILTGMGRDGELGSRAIKEAGGRIFAQDESSCSVWGMPRAVVQAGYADQVVPLSQMAFEMADCARRGARRSSSEKSVVMAR